MSKIDEMIRELCPEGVEVLPLGDVCEVLRGKRVTKSDIKPQGTYPVISGGVTPMGYMEVYNRESNTITVSQYGTAGYVDFQRIKFWANDICYCLYPKQFINNEFLWYVLKGKQDYLYEIRNTDATPFSLPSETLKSVEIPLPPLSIQQEIVRILDSFTQLQSNLEAELASRQKQYEYYRNKLLTFDKDDESMEWKTLGSICDIKGRIGFRGYTREDQVQEGEGALAMSPSNIVDSKLNFETCTYITWEKYEESPEIKVEINDIIFCKTGSTVGKVVYIDRIPCKSTINPQLVLLKNLSEDNKYLFYILGTNQIQMRVKAFAGVGSVPNISQAKLGELELPIPSLSRQREIVSTLDKFELYITKLEHMIELRQMQYEYYREQLLTFE